MILPLCNYFLSVQRMDGWKEEVADGGNEGGADAE